MKLRIRLIKKWKHPYRKDFYPVGTIIQPDLNLANTLLADEFGEVYYGEYPPKQKQKISLSQLKTK